MNRFRFGHVVWIFVLLVGAGTAWAEPQGDKIAADLAAAPPSIPMTEAREKALAALDAFIGRPKSENDPALIAYYQAAIDRGLDKLENDRVTSGVRIFQLYSSSLIIQTPETIFAFDLDQGPNEVADKTPAQAGVPFHMTNAQVSRIAKLVDYQFITHAHLDHCDYQLTRDLLAAGKTVIVTPETKSDLWKNQPWVDKLKTLDQTVKTPNEVGPLKVDVLWDRQWGKSPRHTSGLQCDCYVITTPGGVTIMNKGDINCGLQLYGWLNLLKERGQKIDVVVGSTLFWRGVDITPEWNALLKPLWLPGHNWEFGHRGDTQPVGNCGTYVGAWRRFKQVAGPDKVQSLSWGEWIDVPAPAAKQ